jgi:transposase
MQTKKKKNKMARKACPSDLSDEEWSYLEPLVLAPNPRRMGTPATHSRREIVNAIRYVLRSGCSWRALPHDFPPYTTVHDYFSAWQKSGLWEKTNNELTHVMRVKYVFFSVSK